MSTHVSEATVIEALGGLTSPAPAGVVPGVLIATGLADGYASVPGPTGSLYVAWSGHGVSAVAPAAGDSAFETVFAERVGRPLVRAELPQELRTSLERAFATGKPGDLEYDLSQLTAFQRDVLRVTATIPTGEIRSYGWVAREMGHPGAARAVGNALNRNPVPVLIPCHRVGRSDGTLGEYAFGTEMKRKLLAAEGTDTEAVAARAARGIRYIGSDTTHIYCFPTCRNARRITDAHRVEFKSTRDAARLGYRACKVCRPAAAA